MSDIAPPDAREATPVPRGAVGVLAVPPSTRDPGLTARLTDDAAAHFLARHPGPGAPISVIVPALNEAGTVGSVVRSVPDELCGLGVEVIVVDDGSHDATGSEASAAGALVATLAANTGQGNAFRLGYRLGLARRARVLATVDADGQFDPAELGRLVRVLLDEGADLVTGSRRLGEARTDDTVRALGIVVFGGLLSALTGTRITDPANGLRAMRAEVAATVELRQPQYQSSELLIAAIAHGFRVVEAPVTMYPRTVGTSRKGGNLAYGWRFARVLLGTWWRHRHLARRG